MTPFGILFLGGAKRVSMARHFKQKAEEMGLNLHICSYELTKKEPIAVEAKVIEGLRWDNPDILEDIHRCVKNFGINMIIPFVDSAISVAIAYRDKYGDVFVPAGTLSITNAMFDKVLAAEEFARVGLPIPETVSAFDGRELIAKPRRGSASQGIIRITSAEEFDALGEGYLVQEFITGQEWTVDCYRRVGGGQIECLSPRTRDSVSGGEVCITTVRPDATSIIEAARDAIEALDLRGAITVQFIVDKDGTPLLMEINPRLGGGAVATVAAGVNIPHLILSEATGHPSRPLKAPKPVIVKRYMQEVAFPI